MMIANLRQYFRYFKPSTAEGVSFPPIRFYAILSLSSVESL
jgi:hypothetical protein